MFDLNILRSLLTVALFALFLAIWVWAWSKDRKKEFKDAANIPFMEDEISSTLHEDKK